MNKLFSKQGFSLVEATISAVIFAVAAGGTFAMLYSMKKPSTTSDTRVTAAYYGKQILEDLKAKVDQRNWNQGAGGELDPNGNPHNLPSRVINGVTYCASYTVSLQNPIVGKENLAPRQVNVTVIWNDASCS